ncbi:MAG: exosortase/archaeosortase family protein [Phycisphaerae bacterium]|nr:exosortase/archaeosortase family protein [Phycisphaerae bacterium]
MLSDRILGLAIAMVVAAALIMRDAWADILRVALRDAELSYVLLAPAVIAWLIWVRRARLRQTTAYGGWVGILVIMIGWLTYWYGYYTDPVIWRAGAVITAVGAFIAFMGFGLAVRWAPALFATVFLIPVDPTGRYHIAGPLEEITARLSENVCDLLGIAVSRSGNLLMVNGMGVGIGEACNGMRMILTLFLVCYVVAFSMPLRGYLRFLFLIATPFVAVISNVIRLVPTAWMFGHRSIEAAQRFHDISGWVMTFLAFILLMGFFRLLQWATNSAIYRTAV